MPFNSQASVSISIIATNKYSTLKNLLMPSHPQARDAILKLLVKNTRSYLKYYLSKIASYDIYIFNTY